MIRVLLVCLFALLAVAAHAQEPRITVTPQEEDVIVGQPFTVRVDVLVPTFMPKPPVFPSFEVPGLIVRLPERSTSPISERVGGDTWSGVRRTYRLYPMRAGVTDIPVQDISIVYKDPATNEDVPLSVEVPATNVTAVVPPGARTLDPLIIANGITIDQSWEVADGELAIGDAVIRTLLIKVSGTSALFVPPLLETAAPTLLGEDDTPLGEPGFLPYPEDAQVTETLDRGIMSGTREEQVSYIAQVGGIARFPDISLSWYNLETEEIEEITLSGRDVSIAIPPATRRLEDRRAARRAALGVFLTLVGLWAFWRWVWPHLRPRLQRIKHRYDQSVYAAHRDALQAAQTESLTALTVALSLQTERGHAPGGTVIRALDKVKRAKFRDRESPQNVATKWQALRRALKNDPPPILQHRNTGKDVGLPPLNPFR